MVIYLTKPQSRLYIELRAYNQLLYCRPADNLSGLTNPVLTRR